MLEARDILRVFCSSRSSPGNVAWKAAGIRREATETVIMDADVWATRLLYSCSERRRPPTKKHIPRIYVSKAIAGCFVQGGYSRGCFRVSRPGRWLFFPAPKLLWRRLIPEFSVRFFTIWYHRITETHVHERTERLPCSKGYFLSSKTQQLSLRNFRRRRYPRKRNDSNTIHTEHDRRIHICGSNTDPLIVRRLGGGRDHWYEHK